MNQNKTLAGRELLIFFQFCNSFGQINEINMQMGKADEHEQNPGPMRVSRWY